ncbi:hypothetical protein WICPIJ_009039 [Wickerhamomyces pijperi]|uniref:Uncharacterized protein n=1 Tax=Wickerhamomyces pijperi TaxID=599730 RepID=A0A9P8TFK6_WICPI|nr:hypothetical protein WICPIJ_009039 [Wickerhamomyces pijperi]
MKIGSAVCPKCQTISEYSGRPGGNGKCNLFAAIASPGASKETAGTPYALPTNADSAPPRECPVTQMEALGYMLVTFL